MDHISSKAGTPALKGQFIIPITPASPPAHETGNYDDSDELLLANLYAESGINCSIPDEANAPMKRIKIKSHGREKRMWVYVFHRI